MLRSIRMDVFAMDEDKSIYNTEVQNKDTKNLPKRSRYYQALLDSSLLEPGVVNFNLLNDTFLILIAPFDLFGLGKYRYTFHMTCEEYPHICLNDGTTKIFLNTRGTNEEEESVELVELLHYIELTSEEVTANCTSEKVKEIHHRVSKIKSSEEMGVRYMQAWEEKVYEREEWRQEGIKEGIKEGGIRALIQDNLEEGIDTERICKKLIKRFSIEEEEAREYIRKYSNCR